MNPDKKPQPAAPTPTSKEDLERSDWEGMGQQRFQPEEDKGDKPVQIDPKNKKLDATPGANSLAGQIQK